LAGAPPQTRLGELTALPGSLSCLQGGHTSKGRDGKWEVRERGTRVKSYILLPNSFCTFSNILRIIIIAAGEIFNLKFTKYRLAVGLCPGPLWELKCSPRLPSHNKGGLLLSERKGRGKKTEWKGTVQSMLKVYVFCFCVVELFFKVV